MSNFFVVGDSHTSAGALSSAFKMRIYILLKNIFVVRSGRVAQPDIAAASETADLGSNPAGVSCF
jgi:hypothetical protein